MALRSQFCGKEKWDAEIKKAEDIMFKRIWKGQSNYRLESFVAQHRSAFAMMEEATRHTQHQLPDDYTRVGYVLDHIQCGDSDLKAVIARIRADTADPGPRNNFEMMAAELVPADPVAKKLQSRKRDSAEISAVGPTDDADDGAEVAASMAKPGIGPRTGVHYRFYKTKEYNALSKEQREELREWRIANGLTKKQKAAKDDAKSGGGKSGNRRRGKKGRYNSKEAIVDAVKAQVEKALKEKEEDQSQENDLKNYIMSVIHESATSNSNSSASNKAKMAGAVSFDSSATATRLKSIIKKAKNKS